MKYFIGIFCILFFTTSSLKAEDCRGYIIKLNGDTTWGSLDIPFYKRAINLKKEIQFADMWSGVKFKEGAAKEKKIKPTEISGFGFEHSGQPYHFEVYDMQANSGKKAPKWMGKFFNNFRVFVLRLEDGPLPIYKEFWKSEEERTREDLSERKITTITREINTELYVKNNEGFFIEITPISLNGRGKLKKFMKDRLNLEDEYLQTVDDKAHFDDAEAILLRYNEWKKTKHS